MKKQQDIRQAPAVATKNLLRSAPSSQTADAPAKAQFITQGDGVGLEQIAIPTASRQDYKVAQRDEGQRAADEDGVRFDIAEGVEALPYADLAQASSAGAAGANRSTRSVTMPSVPSAIRCAATDSSFTV